MIIAGTAGGTARYNHVAVISYDGTRFSGFQYLGTKPTVQGVLERALQKVTGEAREALKVQGASRTDSGVHAKGQVRERLYLWRGARGTTCLRVCVYMCVHVLTDMHTVWHGSLTEEERGRRGFCRTTP